MKITATRKVSYSIKVGDSEAFDANVVSEWEGLALLESKFGTFIVDGLNDRPPFGDGQERGIDIVRASTRLVLLLKSEEHKQDTFGDLKAAVAQFGFGPQA